LLFKDEFLHEAGAFFSGDSTLEEINAVTVLAKPEAEPINMFGPARQNQRRSPAPYRRNYGDGKRNSPRESVLNQAA